MCLFCLSLIIDVKPQFSVFFVVVVEVRRIKRDTEMSCAISSEAKRVEGAREGAERGRGSRGPWGQAEPGPLERTLKVNCS